MNKKAQPNFRDNDGTPLLKFIGSELKPKNKLLTPFNIISFPIVLLGLALIVIRFWKGLGAITNLSQEVPWGLWIGFDVVTGVAFAGGAYVLTFMVYILNMKKYHSIVRVTILNGFLAYAFYTGALLLDLGRPWNVVNPIIGNNFGASSVLFLVAWHFLLYMMAELLEFSPAIAEWLGAKRAAKILLPLHAHRAARAEERSDHFFIRRVTAIPSARALHSRTPRPQPGRRRPRPSPRHRPRRRREGQRKTGLHPRARPLDNLPDQFCAGS